VFLAWAGRNAALRVEREKIFSPEKGDEVRGVSTGGVPEHAASQGSRCGSFLFFF